MISLADPDPRCSRRALLRGAAGTATLGFLPLAGCSSGSDSPSDATSTVLSDDRARELAEQFAPTWYFDAHERWFPTDPRPYTSEQDGQTVVDGFDAFDGYSARFDEAGAPPNPTVFYRALQYEDSPLGVVQWWAYSAFDQFSTNFHWHDWEVLHAYIDLDTETPQLYVASAHSRKVPNNEYLDPPETPRILSELGSHSSALSVNERLDSFQRLPGSGAVADITNGALEALELLGNLPIAYGLPRDEGLRLPFLIPQLDDRPIHDHPDLPSVEREMLIDEALTVSRFEDLASPPADLPARETGVAFVSEATAEDGDVSYSLEPIADLEHIDDFTGPQLSFEFAVPGFIEDRIASHITTTGVPWQQSRYDDPAQDISDPSHRQTLAERYDAIDPPGGTNRLIAAAKQAVETEAAPDGEGLETEDPTVESLAFIESEPEAVPTFHGAVVAQDLPEGDHRLTLNSAGNAPHSETVSVDPDAAAVAGVEGTIPQVANEQAVKLSVDPEAVEAELERLAVEDDFAGRLYDAPLEGPDSVYIHRQGAFTAEVEDRDAELGAFRVNPSEEERVTIDRPETGKAVLSTYVADVIEGSKATVEERTTGRGNAVSGLLNAMDAVAAAAERAAERAEAGNPGQADEALGRVVERLDALVDRLESARENLPDPVGNALERRFDQSQRRADQALAAEKL
ncbi:MAG: hypothetical protein ABEH59_01225 [Halobacteriales archaeon]